MLKTSRFYNKKYYYNKQQIAQHFQESTIQQNMFFAQKQQCVQWCHSTCCTCFKNMVLLYKCTWVSHRPRLNRGICFINWVFYNNFWTCVQQATAFTTKYEPVATNPVVPGWAGWAALWLAGSCLESPNVLPHRIDWKMLTCQLQNALF